MKFSYLILGMRNIDFIELVLLKRFTIAFTVNDKLNLETEVLQKNKETWFISAHFMFVI